MQTGSHWLARLYPGGQLVAATTITASLMACAGAAWHVEQVWQGHAAADQLRQLEVADAQTGSVSAPTESFVERLPRTSPSALVIDEAQRAAAGQNVVFGTASIADQPPTDKSLGRTTISLTLRGTYPRIKDTVAAVADRFPALAVTQLSLLRAGSGNEVEARVDLKLATRPLSPIASAGS